MQISIMGTNMDLSPSIKEYIDEKIGNLEKYLGKIDQAKVELERDRHHHTGNVMRAEVMLVVGGKVMRADASSEDIYAARNAAKTRRSERQEETMSIAMYAR
jgi:putative sigma-54 modulation protein